MAPEQAYDEAYAAIYSASLAAARQRGLYGSEAAAYAHRYALHAANAAERSVRALEARSAPVAVSAPSVTDSTVLRPPEPAQAPSWTLLAPGWPPTSLR